MSVQQIIPNEWQDALAFAWKAELGKHKKPAKADKQLSAAQAKAAEASRERNARSKHKNEQRVLAALRGAGKWMSPKDLSALAGLGPATTGRHLATLCEMGLAKRDGYNRFTKFRAAE